MGWFSWVELKIWDWCCTSGTDIDPISYDQCVGKKLPSFVWLLWVKINPHMWVTSLWLCWNSYPHMVVLKFLSTSGMSCFNGTSLSSVWQCDSGRRYPNRKCDIRNWSNWWRWACHRELFHHLPSEGRWSKQHVHHRDRLWNKPRVHQD